MLSQVSYGRTASEISPGVEHVQTVPEEKMGHAQEEDQARRLRSGRMSADGQPREPFQARHAHQHEQASGGRDVVHLKRRKEIGAQANSASVHATQAKRYSRRRRQESQPAPGIAAAGKRSGSSARDIPGAPDTCASVSPPAAGRKSACGNPSACCGVNSACGTGFGWKVNEVGTPYWYWLSV